MRRIGIFLGLFFLCVVFCYRVLSFLFSTPKFLACVAAGPCTRLYTEGLERLRRRLLVFCKLGVTWAFILIPSNQDVMYLFYAFDSFPVTYLSVYLRVTSTFV